MAGPRAPLLTERADPTAPRRLLLDELPWPTDWSLAFGQTRPLILEIGFGRGEMLFHLAETHPEHHVIGVEVSNQSLDKVERRLLRGENDRIRGVHCPAESALALLFTPASLDQVHVNYPDPWFKKRHHGRRVIQRDTVDWIANRLKPGGLLYLATDIRDYADAAHEVLAATPALDNDLDAPWADSMPGRVVTKYEGLARAAGRPGHYFRYRRNDRPAPWAPASEELAMPHLVLHGPAAADLSAIRRSFEPFRYEHEQRHISALGAYNDDRCVLFDVFIQEPTISQRLAIVLTQRDEDLTLGLAQMGLPRPTPGVHVAVARLCAWLTQAWPELEVDEARVAIERATWAAVGGGRTDEA
jgi:tRNA (guanine-N7-)-methyltransferase